MSKSNVAERFSEVVSSEQTVGEDKISRFLANDLEVVLPGVGDIEESLIAPSLPEDLIQRLRRLP